ncbi:bZIP transcription factor 1 [Phytophthora citrophthora]|uniref:BZIP transcription factor 1 n=1 Tax=Phytophthora citrophthora TaxID=4793 RepID=A0AAD9G997_9STRA|nr:bZIP transcription factor 1 [Phytophthora citrophthora]
MDTVSFYPPNYLSLSDNVIGGVIPRDRPTKQFLTPLKNSSQPRRSPSSSATKPMDLPLRTKATLSRCMNEDQKIALKLVSEIKDHRRESSRINQARYLERQRKKMNRLKEDVQRLIEEVKNLELHHTSLSIEVPTHKSIWSVATAYFRLFRHGLNSPAKEANAFALKFLQTTMEPSVTDGSLSGPKALLENWRLFSLYFVDVHVELEHLKRVEGSGILVAFTSTSVKFSAGTLRKVFPHLNSDGHGGTQGGKWSPLADQLRNQQIVMRGSVYFYWDETTGKVTRMETRSDLLTPLLHLPGSLEDVDRVFERALVTPECKLIPCPSTST